MRAPRLFGVLLALALAPVRAETLSDPTQPLGVSAAPARRGAAEPTGPVLQSTLISPERKTAMISGRRVSIGDQFDGAVVTEITPYEVRMSRSGRETSLRLLPKLAKEKGNDG
jgi:MSHA biogenesis protein MshK